MTPVHDQAPPLRNAILVAHSQFRGLLIGLSRRLRNHHGCSVHLHCTTAQEVAFYRRYEGAVFASVTLDNALYSGCRETVTDEAATIALARENEAQLGTTFNELAVSDRHLGRGYALGGFNHPRSRLSEETSYLQMLNGYNRRTAFWRNEIAGRKPDLIINADKVAALLCRAGGIPYRTLAPARYKNFYQWAHTEFFDNPRITERYRCDNDAAAPDLKVPYDIHMELRKKFLKQTRLSGLALNVSRLVAQRLYWRLRGYEKARAYYTSSEVRYLVRQWLDRRQITGAAAVPLSALEGRPFVYYPLHTEPETALQALSPEYFFQLSCIASLSRDLPAGVVLAVKDIYFAVGRRPADFYKQIREFKNVVMLDMLELGLEAVQKCSAIATITGTGGFEGAVLGKPVITFGRHNQYNFLPHVQVVEDETRLKQYIAAALDPAFDHRQAAADGARFLQALKAGAFDLGNFKIADPDKIEEPAVDAALESLLGSLTQPYEAAAPAAEAAADEVAH